MDVEQQTADFSYEDLFGRAEAHVGDQTITDRTARLEQLMIDHGFPADQSAWLAARKPERVQAAFAGGYQERMREYAWGNSGITSSEIDEPETPEDRYVLKNENALAEYIVMLRNKPGSRITFQFVRVKVDAALRNPETAPETRTMLREIDRLLIAEGFAPQKPPPEAGAFVQSMADIQPVHVEWLWKDRIPLGRLTLLVARPGEGKSFATCDFAARVSTGTPWPDGAPCKRGQTLIMNAEDGLADTVRPRLDACGADVTRIAAMTTKHIPNAEGKMTEVSITLGDIAVIEMAIEKMPDLRLVVVDPIGSFLGGKTDANAENEVRAILGPLARMAERRNIAVLLVAHRRKAAGGSADEMAMGSRAFTGLARSVWHLCRDRENKHRRLLLPGKNNLAPEGTGLAFSITGDPARPVWEEELIDMSADEFIEADAGKPGPRRVKREDASLWLEDRLSGGPAPSKMINEDAKEEGYSFATIRRASEEIGVVKKRSELGTGWEWRLPNAAEAAGVM